MKLSAKTEYACAAVLELTLRHPCSDPVCIRDIAAAHDIPARFLVQILLQLKSAGLVTSTRGAAGGYRLALAPEEIALADVMDVIDGSGTAESNLRKPSPSSQALLATWREAAEAERSRLVATTFADLANQIADARHEPMYFI